MILRGGKIALVLGVFGALGKLLGAFTGLGLGTVSRRRFLPVVDLLLQSRLRSGVADGAEA